MSGLGLSIEKIQFEINKCQLLCANCHMKKSAEERREKTEIKINEILKMKEQYKSEID